MAITLDDDTQKRINGLVSNLNSAPKANDLELEIRLKNQVLYQDFSRFYTYLDGKTAVPECTLDISVAGGGDVRRATIYGEDNIRTFCQTKNISGKVISKQHVGNSVDIPEYGFRVALNTETAIVGADAESFYKLIQESEHKVSYRFKQRLSIKLLGHPFRFDLTIVKQSSTKGESILSLFSNIPTYEVECEFLPTAAAAAGIALTLDMVVSMVALMAQIRQECEYPISATVQQQVRNELAQLALTTRGGGGTADAPSLYLGAKVATLGRDEFQKVGEQKYGVTDKADGERRLLFIGTNGWLFLSDMDLNIITRIPAQVAPKTFDLQYTVLDGELLVEKTDNGQKLYKFYAFDILLFNGKALANDNLRGRYLQMAKVISSLSAAGSFDESQFFPDQLNCVNTATILVPPLNVQLIISAKTYHIGAAEAANRIWCMKDSYPYPLDGLIFTPYNDMYPYANRTWLTQYKWKPPALNSIDFEIQFARGNKHTLLVGVPQGKTTFGTITLAKDAVGRQDGIKIQDHTIVECVFEHNEWVVLKTRIDKTAELLQLKARGDNSSTTANFHTTAKAIWKTIQDPVDEKNFCGEYYKSAALITDKEKSKVFRELQNTVKKSLLDFAVRISGGSGSGGVSLIDFSCGKGGDFYKWQELQLKVVGIDIHKQNLEQFIARVQNPNPQNFRSSQNTIAAKQFFQNNVSLYVGNTGKLLNGQLLIKVDMTDEPKSAQKVELPQHDIGVSFFSIHYYFKKEIDATNFFINAAQYIKPNGHLLITCLDGETVFKELNRSSTGTLEGKVTDTTIWKIVKQYDSTKELDRFGVQIGFYMHTIFRENTLEIECLVPHGLLMKIANAHGFTLKQSKFFSQIAFQDKTLDTDKTLADLNTFKNWHRYYIFTRNPVVAEAPVAVAPAVPAAAAPAVPAAAKPQGPKRKRSASNNTNGADSQNSKKPKLAK
jgi:hypothetical protein